MSSIDNLIKGAAGQAIQAWNVANGRDETLGLPDDRGDAMTLRRREARWSRPGFAGSVTRRSSSTSPTTSRNCETRARNVVDRARRGTTDRRTARRVGVESRFHDGLRVTDVATMRYVMMALAEVNVRVVAALNDAGLASVGLCGSDASLLRSESVGEPHDRVGDTPLVNHAVLDALWSAGFTPVVSPVALDKAGEPLNCNADTVAGAIAAELGADVLVLLSDIDQLLADVDDASSAMTTVSGAQIACHATLGSGPRRDDAQVGRRARRPARRCRADSPGERHSTLTRCATPSRASIPTTEVVR